MISVSFCSQQKNGISTTSTDNLFDINSHDKATLYILDSRKYLKEVSSNFLKLTRN